jgi:hypothetical protein
MLRLSSQAATRDKQALEFMKVTMLQNSFSRNAGSLAIVSALLGLVSTPALAEDPKFIEEFNDWSAYSYRAGGGKVCYIVSQPKDSKPKNVKRDKIFFLVQHRPKDKVRSEVSTIIGYKFKEGSTASIDVDGGKMRLFTNGDGAWAESGAVDRKIVAAMKAGKSMVISGTSWRGTKTVDRYSLSGITAAMNKIDSICK